MGSSRAILELVGDAALKKALAELSENSARRVARGALVAGLKPLRKEARRLAEPGAGVIRGTASGELSRAIAAKVWARRDRATGKIYVKSRISTVNGKTHNPAKIAHLVEFGHGGRHPAAPRSFMRAAKLSQEGAIKAGLTEGARKALAKEVARLNSKGRR